MTRRADVALAQRVISRSKGLCNFMTRRADVALARRVIHSGGGSGSGGR